MNQVEGYQYVGKTTGQIVLEVVRARIRRRLLEESTTPFYIFRTDTKQVLAKGVVGYDAAKQKANEIRKRYGLKWDQVSFKSERKGKASTSTGSSSYGRHQASTLGGVPRSGRVDFAQRFNPSKGRRFRGYYDKSGNYHDLD